MIKVLYETPAQEDRIGTIVCDDYHTDKEPLLTCILEDADEIIAIPLNRVIKIRD